MSEITREEFLHALLEEKFVDYRKVINYVNQLESRIKELEKTIDDQAKFLLEPRPPEEEKE